MAKRVQYYTLGRNVVEQTRAVWTLYLVLREVGDDVLLQPDAHCLERRMLIERARWLGWHPLKDVDMKGD
jgi:hypothetical protein